MGAAFAAGALAGLRSLGQAQQARQQAQVDALNLALGKQQLESGKLELSQNKQMADLLSQTMQSPDFQSMPPAARIAFIKDPTKFAAWQANARSAGIFDALAGSAKTPQSQAIIRQVGDLVRQSGLDPTKAFQWLKDSGVVGSIQKGRDASLEDFQAARELGFPLDPDSWTPEQANAVSERAKQTAVDRAKAIADVRKTEKPASAPRLNFDTEYEGTKAFRVGRDPTTGAVVSRNSAGTAKPTAQQIAALGEFQTARASIPKILDLGRKVLPANQGAASLITPEKLAFLKRYGNPEVAAFDTAKIALIPALRAVAGAARINPQEIEKITSAISDATSYAALQQAVNGAQDMLNSSQRILQEDMGMSGGTSGPATSLAPDMSAMTGVTGTPVYGPDGKVIGFTK